ncbi:MAG TPA: hypothetical protein VGB63_18675 [Pedobacter sp.]|jgi:hypothetical protein
MKQLTQLINTEKAQLLHQLFPDEIPQLLQFVQGVCEATQENEEIYLQKWDNGLFGFDFWLNQLREVETKIAKYDKDCTAIASYLPTSCSMGIWLCTWCIA